MKTTLISTFFLLLLYGCQPSLHHIDTGHTLEYRLGDKSLFTYNYATVYPPAGLIQSISAAVFSTLLIALMAKPLRICHLPTIITITDFGMHGPKPLLKVRRSISGMWVRDKEQYPSGNLPIYLIPDSVLFSIILHTLILFPRKK